jgi:hypothetical protein
LVLWKLCENFMPLHVRSIRPARLMILLILFSITSNRICRWHLSRRPMAFGSSFHISCKESLKNIWDKHLDLLEDNNMSKLLPDVW